MSLTESQTKIESLTPEQEAKLVEYKDKWLAIGLSTEPTDRKRAEAAFKLVYEAAELTVPSEIVWFKSPMEGAKHVAKLMGTNVSQQMYEACYGLHDAGWLSFYEYFMEVCNLEAPKRLTGLFEVAKSCGWFWPLDTLIVATDRPVHLSRDTQGRLHGTDRAAIEYADGWGVYAWHGVRVPKHVILAPTTITTKEIDVESNSEVRRVMIERYGAARYVEDSGAKAIGEDRFGTLYRKEVPNDEPIVMVRVINSTPEPDGEHKIYWLRVPPDIKTAKEGIAWTFNVSGKVYDPQVET